MLYMQKLIWQQKLLQKCMLMNLDRHYQKREIFEAIYI